MAFAHELVDPDEDRSARARQPNGYGLDSRVCERVIDIARPAMVQGMIPDLFVILSLGVAVAFLAVAARRLRAAPSILMLLAGVALAFVPNLPPVALKPDLLFLLFLPPLLYNSGVNMSWRSFRSNLRPILALAIGCVLFTAAAVAAVAHFALGLSWPVGFVLGAIVSPPDAVAPIALLRRMAGVPIKGESYFVAEITAGRVGEDQAPPRREFD